MAVTVDSAFHSNLAACGPQPSAFDRVITVPATSVQNQKSPSTQQISAALAPRTPTLRLSDSLQRASLKKRATDIRRILVPLNPGFLCCFSVDYATSYMLSLNSAR